MWQQQAHHHQHDGHGAPFATTTRAGRGQGFIFAQGQGGEKKKFALDRADRLFYSLVYCFIGTPLVLCLDLMLLTKYIGTALHSANDDFAQKYLLYYSKQRFVQECFLESAPMLLFQIYLLNHPDGGADGAGITPMVLYGSAVGSVFSILHNVFNVYDGASVQGVPTTKYLQQIFSAGMGAVVGVEALKNGVQREIRVFSEHR
jgi:hypothetical protein